MRQPFCGWLLATVVVSAATSAQASPGETAHQRQSGAPCTATAQVRPGVDITCCHGPDLRAAVATPRRSPLLAVAEPAQPSDSDKGGKTK
jgi:hypothetical protein